MNTREIEDASWLTNVNHESEEATYATEINARYDSYFCN